MSFKYLQLKLGIFALGLVAVIVMISFLGANEHATAATSAIDCSKPLPGQEQACASKQGDEAKVTAWALPAATSVKNLAGQEMAPAEITTSAAPERELSTGGLPPEALILFAVALAGIAFLGRRRKVQARKD